MEIVAIAPAGMEFAAQKDKHAELLLAGARRRKWRPAEETDAVIRDAYRRMIGDNDRQALTRAASRLGWPKYRVTRRGVELGLARVKEADWSLAEVAVLEENAQYGPPVIRRRLAEAGFHRTQTAIVLKRKRLELTASHLGYSATTLSKLMGIDGHAVTHWIECGMLAGERRGTARTARQGGDSWFIRQGDVRAFLYAHPEEWDLRKVEQWWFLDLVTDGKICR